MRTQSARRPGRHQRLTEDAVLITIVNHLLDLLRQGIARRRVSRSVAAQSRTATCVQC